MNFEQRFIFSMNSVFKSLPPSYQTEETSDKNRDRENEILDRDIFF